MKLKNTKYSDYMINEETNVVINKNNNKLNEYKMKIDEAKEIQKLKLEVKSINDSLNEIKNLLLKAIG